MQFLLHHKNLVIITKRLVILSDAKDLFFHRQIIHPGVLLSTRSMNAVGIAHLLLELNNRGCPILRVFLRRVGTTDLNLAVRPLSII